MWADRGRQLSSDADGRHLLISCGCALFNARAAVAAAGYGVTVDRFADPQRPDLLARLTTVEEPATQESSDGVTQVAAAGECTAVFDDRAPIAVLDPVIGTRRMSQQPFAGHRVPHTVVRDLVAAAAAEDAHLLLVGNRTHRSATGLFDDGQAVASSASNGVLVVATATDTPWAWLRAGEALGRTLLTVTAHGYAANLLHHVTGGPPSPALLAANLALNAHPQVLVQIGWAPGTPGTRRRRLVDVLTEYPWTAPPATPVPVTADQVRCR